MGINGSTEQPITIARVFKDEGDEQFIRLEGRARAIDLDVGEEPQESLATPTTDSPVELENIRLDIDRKGVPLKPAGHVKVVRAMIDVDAADEIENPLASGFVKGSSWLLDKLHTGINFIYSSVATGDKYLFKKGLDRFTGLNELDDKAELHARWAERAGAATIGAGVFSGVRSRSVMGGLRGVKGFWKSAWPVGAMLYLSQTKVASSLEEGAGLVALGGALFLLNYPTNTAYRRVITPVGAKPMALKLGLLFGLSHFGLNYYWDNMSAQQRLLPILHDQPSSDGYKPWRWDLAYTQGKTTYSHSIGWGLFGSAWGSLLAWQTGLADRASRKVLGFGKEVLQIREGTPSYRFVNEGVLSRWRVTRGAKAFVASFAPRRLGFTAFSTAIGLPLGIGLGRLTFETQDFSSMESVTGTPARAVVTAPLATAGIAACTAMFGVAHPWCSYAFNMYPVNWAWQAGAQQGEMIYQVAKARAEDYKSSEDPNEKRHFATMLFNLHRAAHDNGKPKEENEKLKIGELLADVGIDVKGIEEAAVRYASPPQ